MANKMTSLDLKNQHGPPPARHLYEFRADKFSYFALGGLPLLFSLLFFCFSVFSHYDARYRIWILLLLSTMVFIGVIFYLITFRVAIKDGSLTYQRLFHRTRSIKLSDIKCARVSFSLATSKLKRPPFGLSIEPKPGAAAKSFVINIKFLRRKDLHQLVELLGSKVSDDGHTLGGIFRPRENCKPK